MIRAVEKLPTLLKEAVAHLRDYGNQYQDDGSNEPLDLAREIEESIDQFLEACSAELATEAARELGRQAARIVVEKFAAELVASYEAQPASVAISALPLAEYDDDFGPVTWWRFPVEEPAWIGTPNDSEWPGYHTHWTPHPEVPAMLAAAERKGASDEA